MKASLAVGADLGRVHGKEEIAGSTADRPIAVYYALVGRSKVLNREFGEGDALVRVIASYLVSVVTDKMYVNGRPRV